MLSSLLVLILGIGLVGSTPAENDPYVLPRLDGEVVLDGSVDEPAWASVRPLPLTTYEPVFEAPPTEASEIRVAYDDHYLYVSGRFFDSEPDQIRSNSMYRDRYSGDDTFAILLDAFNDNENALWFFTNPAGVRFDMAVSQDGEGGGSRGPPGNVSWNTFWDVATRVTSEGWSAEMRIPFSSLGFQDRDGRVVMGMSTYRYISRKNERHTFPAIPPTFRDGFRKPSLMRDVVLEGVTSQKPLYVSPYIIGGMGRATELNEEETAFVVDDDLSRDLGLDVKYALTSNLTLDLTVNTDFAQVEADDQQVNLTRFSLFFPEKRQFFQERAGLFEFQTGRSDQLFYTRRIGLDEGEPVRIIGGARLTGRVGDWDMGFLDMQTAGRSDLDEPIPAENFGVVRLRRQVLNPYSYAGGMVTSRLGDDGSYNVAVGLDAVVRTGGNDYLTVQWAQTFDDELIKADSLSAIRGALGRITLERRNSVGWNYEGSLTWYGPDYRPDMGFVRREGVFSPSARISHGKLMSADSPIRLRRISFFSRGGYRHDDRSLDSSMLGAFLTWEMKSGASITLSPRMNVEDLPEVLELPEDTYVPVGRYVFPTIETRFSQSNGRLFRTDWNVEGGGFYDGWSLTASCEPTFIASRFVELGGEYQANLVGLAERNQSFVAHVFRFRSQVALNTKVSASAFIQYSDVADRAIANIRFRYNFAEGSDLWIVYNEGLNTHRFESDPVPPVTSQRAALLKFTHTIGI